MINLPKGFRLAAVAACCFLGSNAWAAAPDDLAVAPIAPDVVAAPAAIGYALDTEMVVHNWVLCVSAPVAEKLARARTSSAGEARSIYAELSSARSCGQFPELHVILRERLYESGDDTRVFGALVNLSGDWASAFVVSGSLSED